MDQQTIRAILSFLLLVPAAAAAAAQQSPDLPPALARVEPCETVTIMDIDGRRLVGRVSAVSASGLTLVQRGQTTAVPLQRVARITIKDSSRNGAKIGGLIGAAIGVAGGAAINAICANEGGGCGGIMLALGAAGFAGGAGIGWLGDRIHQPVVYALPGAPREFAPEVRVKLSTDSRGGMTVPGVGGAWGMTLHSGLGFEVNADRSAGRGAERPGTSFDGRVLYFFGKGRYRLYGLAGAGYFEYDGETYSYLVPPMGPIPERLIEGKGRVQGVAPLVGGGVRVDVTPKISIRPEVIWHSQPGGGTRSGLRASVGAGFGW